MNRHGLSILLGLLGVVVVAVPVGLVLLAVLAARELVDRLRKEAGPS